MTLLSIIAAAQPSFQAVGPASASRGDTVTVRFLPNGQGGFRVDEVQLRTVASSSLRLAGRVTAVSGETLELLGWTVGVDVKTDWDGVTPPTPFERAHRTAAAGHDL